MILIYILILTMNLQIHQKLYLRQCSEEGFHCLSTIVIKVKEKDCELNLYQTIYIIICMQYWKWSYLFMLEKDPIGKNLTYSSC